MGTILTVIVGGAEQSGKISGGLPFVIAKNGAGALTLSGVNTYQSNTALLQGALIAGSNSAFGTGRVQAFASGVTLGYANGVTVGNDVDFVAGPGQIVTFYVGSGKATQAGAIGTPFGGFMVKTGAGTLTLANANVNLFADVRINGGALAITNDTALGLGLVTLNGGALQAAANGLIVNNDFAINKTGGTIDTNGKTLTILGDIFDGNGPGSLTKTGAGTLILDGFNDYSGATNILKGNVFATDDFALSEFSAFKVNKGAGLQLDEGVNAAIGSLADGPAGGGNGQNRHARSLDVHRGRPRQQEHDLLRRHYRAWLSWRRPAPAH